MKSICGHCDGPLCIRVVTGVVGERHGRCYLLAALYERDPPRIHGIYLCCNNGVENMLASLWFPVSGILQSSGLLSESMPSRTTKPFSMGRYKQRLGTFCLLFFLSICIYNVAVFLGFLRGMSFGGMTQQFLMHDAKLGNFLHETLYGLPLPEVPGGNRFDQAATVLGPHGEFI